MFSYFKSVIPLWKRLWCWEGLRAGGEGDDRDGRMASLTRWTWVWVNSECWLWTGRPGVLRFMGSQRIGHDWVTELNWTDLWSSSFSILSFCLFILLMGFSRQEHWSGLSFPSPVDHILSDLSPWPAHLGSPHRAWLSFTELDKAVVLVWLNWLVFCDYGFRYDLN